MKLGKVASLQPHPLNPLPKSLGPPPPPHHLSSPFITSIVHSFSTTSTLEALKDHHRYHRPHLHLLPLISPLPPSPPWKPSRTTIVLITAHLYLPYNDSIHSNSIHHHLAPFSPSSLPHLPHLISQFLPRSTIRHPNQRRHQSISPIAMAILPPAASPHLRPFFPKASGRFSLLPNSSSQYRARDGRSMEIPSDRGPLFTSLPKPDLPLPSPFFSAASPGSSSSPKIPPLFSTTATTPFLHLRRLLPLLYRDASILLNLPPHINSARPATSSILPGHQKKRGSTHLFYCAHASSSSSGTIQATNSSSNTAHTSNSSSITTAQLLRAPVFALLARPP